MRAGEGRHAGRRLKGMRWGGARNLFRTLAAALSAEQRAGGTADPSRPGTVRERLRRLRTEETHALDAALGGAGTEGASLGEAAPGAASPEAPALRESGSEAEHTAPGAVLPFLERSYAAGLVHSPDPETRRGLAQSAETAAQAAGPGGTDPDARRGLALPEETEALPVAAGHGGEPTHRPKLTGGMRTGYDLRFRAAAETAVWRLGPSAAWRDLYVNPYYDYAAWADELRDGETEELLRCGSVGEGKYLRLYALKSRREHPITGEELHLFELWAGVYDPDDFGENDEEAVDTAVVLLVDSGEQEITGLDFINGLMRNIGCSGLASAGPRANRVVAYDPGYWE